MKKKNIELYILLDDHKNTNYCKNSICIDKFIENISNSNKYNIYVEEPPYYKDIHLMWSSPHTQKLLKLYKTKKLNNIFPIDIRSVFQYDLNENISIKNILCNIYYLFSYLFKKKLKFDINIKPSKQLKKLRQQFKSLIFKNKNNTFIKKHIIEIYLAIKDIYKCMSKINLSIYKYKKLYKNTTHDLLEFPFNKLKLNTINCMIYYEYLVNSIMEFYFILLLFTSKHNQNNKIKKNILYAGAYHCINIGKILQNIYKFKIIKQSKNLNINLNKLGKIVKKFNNNCIKI